MEYTLVFGSYNVEKIKKNFYFMKKFPILIICLMLMGSLQAQWRQLNTGCNADLYGIACVNKDTVLTCGYNGTILKTINGGTTWESKNSGSIQSLFVIKFADENIGYAAGGNMNGSNGILLKTVDGGESWTELISNDTNIKTINNLFVIDRDTLYLLEYLSQKLIKSTDGGITWNTKILAPFITDFYFIDSVGYLINSGVAMYKSYDYGSTWNYLTSPYVYNIDFYDSFLPVRSTNLYFKNINEGQYFQGCGKTFSTDGFETFQMDEHISGTSYFTEFVRVKFLGNTGCWIGYLFSIETGEFNTYSALTRDGGETWSSYHLGLPHDPLYAIDGFGDSTFYVTSTNGKIFYANGMEIGIENYDANEENISLYPNPVQEKISCISQFFIKEIRIYDLYGKEIKKLEVNDFSTEIDFLTCTAGIYFLQIYSDAGIITKKIVKQ